MYGRKKYFPGSDASVHSTYSAFKLIWLKFDNFIAAFAASVIVNVSVGSPVIFTSWICLHICSHKGVFHFLQFSNTFFHQIFDFLTDHGMYSLRHSPTMPVGCTFS